ncbi:MAG TPA: hypothetical protein VLH81_10150 [Desulfobacterales bacterium]|nr:hypothetical protein [Desulfobacterales bacterium]
MRIPFIARVVDRIAGTPYARRAAEEKADLSAFKEKPSFRVLLGVFLIGFSYVVGWPAISALAALSVYFGEPLLAVVGGPVMYGLSHLVFIAGMALSGARYSAIFLRWATRVLVEKLGRDPSGLVGSDGSNRSDRTDPSDHKIAPPPP